jgi:uncharacterized protein
MENMKGLLLLLLLIAVGCNGGNNKTIEKEALVRQGWVTDYGDALTGPEKESIAAMLATYEKETCHQIVVVIVQDLDGETIEAFSTRTALAWEIGQEFLNNGILITIALQEGSARIEAGSGLDWIVKDRIADTILRQEMFPHFREDRLAAGIIKGLEALMTEARKRTYPPAHRPSVCL